MGFRNRPQRGKTPDEKGRCAFGKRRACQKKVAIAPFDGIFSAHGMVLRPNEEVVDKDFFPIFISSDYFLDAAIAISVGSLSPTINWKDLARLEFDLPPMEEQKKLAEVLWSVNDTLQAYQKLLNKTDELVKSQFVEMFNANAAENCTAKMSDYADILGGYAFKSKYFLDSGTPVIRISDISDDVVSTSEAVHYDSTFWEENPRYRVKNKDILMAMSGATTGKVGVYNSSENALLNQRVGCIRSKAGKANQEFLFWIFKLDWIYNLVQEIAAGSAQPNISIKEIGELPAPSASYNTQLDFSKIVMQAEKSKVALQNSIASLQTAKRCLLADTLGRKE